MTAVAVTLLGLWHEGIDVNRSYQGVARATAEAIESLAGTGTKIDGADLPGGIRAALHYYGGIDFARPGEKAPLKLVRVRSDYAPAKALTEAISRPHTDETFYLVAARFGESCRRHPAAAKHQIPWSLSIPKHVNCDPAL